MACVHNSVYDFSVCFNDSHAVLQLHVDEGRLYVFQGGSTKRSHSLVLLEKFTSNHLFLCIRFLDGDLDLEVENLKDKADIFQILFCVADEKTNADKRTKAEDLSICSGNIDISETSGGCEWRRKHCRICKGYFTISEDKNDVSNESEQEEIEYVEELWDDGFSVQMLGRLSFKLSVPRKEFCFQHHGSPEDTDSWINAFRSGLSRPPRLTEDDICVAVLGEDTQDEPLEPELQDDPADDEDVVDFGDPSSAAALFSALLPRKKSKVRHKPTEDEEFVMIELIDVLKHRAKMIEDAECNRNADQRIGFTEDKPDDKDQLQNINTERTRKQKSLGGIQPVTLDSHEETPGGSSALPPPPPPPGIPPPPPPPPPPGVADGRSTSGQNRLKLSVVPQTPMKAAHWSEVTGNMVDISVWKTVEDMSSRMELKLLEEQFFTKQSTNMKTNTRGSNRSNTSEGRREVLLDNKRAQIIGIALGRPYSRALGHLKDAINSITELEYFNLEKLRNVKSVLPDPNIRKMYESRSRDELLPIDQFMFDLCNIAHLEVRLALTNHVIILPKRIASCNEHLKQLSAACKEVLTSKSFKEILGYLRTIGNYLNAGRNSSLYGAYGFKITTVDKLLDIKNTDSGFTVLDFLVKQIQTGKPELLGWTLSLKHVTGCADLSVQAIQADVKAMEEEIKKWRTEVTNLKNLNNQHQDKYFSDVQSFHNKYEVEVKALREQVSNVGEQFKHVLEYLGENLDRKSDELFSAIADFKRKFDNTRGQSDKK